MAYEVTATRKRPRSFEQIVGQEFVVATLRGAIERREIAHAFLFSGPRGVGKTSAARVLARALNCAAGPTPTPCDDCNECREISAGSSLDVIEIDGASNTGVDDVRAIKDEVLFPPAAARYKVYIIDEVHMLSTSAFNALLKTVEEPPPYVVFIFATTEIHKVPATIRSRCQQFTFRLFSTDEIRDRLAEVVAEQGLQADEEALIWIAKEADGSLRDAYTTFDQIASFAGDRRISIDAIRDTIGALSMDELNRVGTLIGSDDATAMLTLADEILERGVSVERFVIALADYLRSLLLLRHGVTRPGILGYPEASFSVDARSRLSVSQLELAGELLLEVHRNLKQSVSPRFELELLLSRLARVTGMVTPDELLAEVHAIKGQFTGDEGAAGGAPAGSAEAAAGPRGGGRRAGGGALPTAAGGAPVRGEPRVRPTGTAGTAAGASAGGRTPRGGHPGSGAARGVDRAGTSPSGAARSGGDSSSVVQGGAARGGAPAGGAVPGSTAPRGAAASGAAAGGAAPGTAAAGGASAGGAAPAGAARGSAPVSGAVAGGTIPHGTTPGGAAPGAGALRGAGREPAAGRGGATEQPRSYGPPTATEPGGPARALRSAPAPVMRDSGNGGPGPAPAAAAAAEPPGRDTADPASAASAAPGAAPEVLHEIGAKVRAQNQMSLAASVERAVAAAVTADRITMTFAAGDRYHGAQVAGAQQTVASAASEILGRAVSVGVDYRREPGATAAAHADGPNDADVGRFCKVFRGEVVKEIAHGI